MSMIVKLMNDAETLTHLQGHAKKEFVLLRLQEDMNHESYVKYSPLLSMIVDGLCKISKDDITLAINKVSKWRCC
jgi:hypothetical protein